MLLASTTLFFRVHTRVLLTLFVALCIALLCLTGRASQSAPVLCQVAPKTTAQTSMPIEQKRADLPRTVIRLFFLLPHLIPQNS